MPNICAEPGPGFNQASRRNLKVGADLIDTISAGLNESLEKGSFTIDRIEMTPYTLVSD